MSQARLYARINALVGEVRSLKGDNSQLRERNAELERSNQRLAVQNELLEQHAAQDASRIRTLIQAALAARDIIDAQSVPQYGRQVAPSRACVSCGLPEQCRDPRVCIRRPGCL